MRIIKLALCLTFLAACQDQENRVISEQTTPGGLTFTYMPITEKGVTDVTFAAFWKSNWITKPDANTTIPGIGALALSNGGTVDLPPQNIQALFQEKNSYAFITPMPNGINAEIEIPIDYFDEILPVANELLVRPQFDPAWLNRIQAGEKERLATLQNNPDVNLWQALYANIWNDHPLLDYNWIRDPENQISGTQDSYQEWHKSTFGLDNITLVVAGPASVEQAGRALDQLLDGLPKTSDSFESLPPANPVQAKRIYLVQPDQQATKILIFGEMASNSLNSEFEDSIFANLFGGGPDSTLFKEIRGNENATYGLQNSAISYTGDNRYYFITGTIANDGAANTINRIEQVYDQFKSDMDITQFKEIKDKLADMFHDAFQGVNSSARAILFSKMYGVDPNRVPNIKAHFDSITPERLQSYVRQNYPDSSEMMIIALGSDPTEFSDYCVITKPEDAKDCP